MRRHPPRPDVAFARAGGDSPGATTTRREFGGDGSEKMTSGYRQTYDRWRADPQAFWAEAAR
jgi:hypothetical protein